MRKSTQPNPIAHEHHLTHLLATNHITIFFSSDIAPRVFHVRNGTVRLRESCGLALDDIVATAADANSPAELVAAAHALYDELRARRLRLFVAREIVLLAEVSALMREDEADQG